MNWDRVDRDATLARYSERLDRYGASPEALGWTNGRQLIRFGALCEALRLDERPVVLDIGCGFGDLNGYLSAVMTRGYQYIGIDLVPEFIDEAKRRWEAPHVEFRCQDAFEEPLPVCDYAVASGLLNHKLTRSDMRRLRRRTLGRALESARKAVAFDFLSSRVEYTREHTFHHVPEEVLSDGYSLTRRLRLFSDYLPFEFGLVLRKDDNHTSSATYTEPLPHGGEPDGH